MILIILILITILVIKIFIDGFKQAFQLTSSVTIRLKSKLSKIRKIQKDILLKVK